MTAINDRRHNIQRHTIYEVQDAIKATIYGDENKRIMRGLFINNQTYEATAADVHMSQRGLYKRVGMIYPLMDDYLNKRIN